MFESDKLLFPAEIHHQDLALIPLLFLNAERVVFSHKRIYNYYSNMKGVSSSFSELHVISPFRAMQYIYDYTNGTEVAYLYKEELLKASFSQIYYNFNLRKKFYEKNDFELFIYELNDFCKRNNIGLEYLLNGEFSRKILDELVLRKIQNGIVIPILPIYSLDFEELYSSISNERNNYLYLISSYNAIIKSKNYSINVIKKENDDLKNELDNFKSQNNNITKVSNELKEEYRRLEEINYELEKYNGELIEAKEWFVDRINYLEAEIKVIDDLTSKNNIIESEKAWYSRTYDHLPKWYLKLGGVFRRIGRRDNVG